MADAAHQTGSVEISSSLRTYDERNDRFTTATTTTMNIGERGTISAMMSVSENEDNETLATLSNATDEAIVNELTASTVLSSTSTSPSISSQLSVPTQFAEINILPPTTDDRLIFNDIDISARFHSFKQDVNSSIQQGIAITVEEHVQHLLALSSILLLKPARTHKDLHKHIDLSTCDALILPTTRKVRVDFNLCLSEASLVKVATRARSISTSL
ncbi:hypothetical protein RMATCC62417_01640 [Rhizopus microsporus]|nr:hypothetical protein RMATCC62417_01640 [Rhizopus microsporus]